MSGISGPSIGYMFGGMIGARDQQAKVGQSHLLVCCKSHLIKVTIPCALDEVFTVPLT